MGYKIAYGYVTTDGSLEFGEGAYTFKSSTGRYIVRFAEGGYDNAPALILTNSGGVQRGIRNNQLDDSKENRKVAGEANVYQLYQGGSPRSSETPELKDTPFHFVAIAKSGDVSGQISTGSTDPNNSSIPGGQTNSSILTSETKVRIAAARIDGRGTRKAFDAYSCRLNQSSIHHSTKKTGIYRIDFDNGFTGTPAVVATVEEDDEKVRTVVIQSVSSSGVDIKVYDEDGDLVDAFFNFIAIGPGSNNAASSKFVYGVIHRDGTKKFGDGFNQPTTSDDVKSGTATYTVTFSSAFKKKPVIVACAEHMEEAHLRQLQVETSNSQAVFQVVGRTEYGDTPAYNDSAFHFIAYAPS